MTLPCGEIDLNATTNGGGVPTGTTDTVNGGIDIQASRTLIAAAVMSGNTGDGVRISGAGQFSDPHAARCVVASAPYSY